MTSAPALDPIRILDPAAELHGCLDRLARLEPDRLGAEAKEELLRSLARAEARVAAVRLRVLAAADRAQAGTASGAANTGQWAARVANSDQVTAQREVGLAQRLDRRHATREALGDGRISPEHAAVIVRADRELPPSLPPEQRDLVERSLLAKAQELSPGSLRRVARRALAAVEADLAAVDAHENELVADEEARARAKVRLTLHDNDDGTVTGHFTVPRLHGELLRKILQTITAPRRGRLGASQAHLGEREERTDWDRARGAAFCELLEHLPTDHLHPRTAATLVVTTELETLQEALRVAHLDTGGSLSAGEVRRLACNSRLIPAVMGGASLPLDLGRANRLFTEAQRTALGLKYRTCAVDGCERAFAWCELHHFVAWALGGNTDLADAVPVCHFHHQRIHDQRYDHARARDGTITLRLRT